MGTTDGWAQSSEGDEIVVSWAHGLGWQQVGVYIGGWGHDVGNAEGDGDTRGCSRLRGGGGGGGRA